MEYTKGKWNVDNVYGISTDNGGLIVEAVQDDYTKVVAMINAHKGEAEANAHLIAAAPDMYEALKEVAAIDFDDMKQGQISGEILYKVLQALAKAERGSL